jgi:hypothetical protein
MSDVAGSITRLIEISRRLRTAAGELGQLDVKSQIVDEISALQEIRDTVQGTGDNKTGDDAEPDEAETSVAAPEEILVDAGIGIVKPTGKEETYSLTPEEDDGVAEAATPAGDDVEDESSQPEKTGPSVNERDALTAMTEMRLADLEQLEQAATKRMNDVPTAEQRQIKAKAQKAGREAGKSGKELQHYTYGAMQLSSAQRSEIQAARKDVLALRDAISKERKVLEQLAAMDS